jgi:hypothetical protein
MTTKPAAGSTGVGGAGSPRLSARTLQRAPSPTAAVPARRASRSFDNPRRWSSVGYLFVLPRLAEISSIAACSAALT